MDTKKIDIINSEYNTLKEAEVYIPECLDYFEIKYKLIYANKDVEPDEIFRSYYQNDYLTISKVEREKEISTTNYKTGYKYKYVCTDKSEYQISYINELNERCFLYLIQIDDNHRLVISFEYYVGSVFFPENGEDRVTAMLNDMKIDIK